MLVSFILLAKYLEVMTKGNISDALSKLTEIAPETALLLTLDKDGNAILEREISTQLLQRNDSSTVLMLSLGSFQTVTYISTPADHL